MGVEGKEARAAENGRGSGQVDGVHTGREEDEGHDPMLRSDGGTDVGAGQVHREEVEEAGEEAEEANGPPSSKGRRDSEASKPDSLGSRPDSREHALEQDEASDVEAMYTPNGDDSQVPDSEPEGTLQGVLPPLSAEVSDDADEDAHSDDSSTGSFLDCSFTYNPTPQNIPPPVETGAIGEKHVIVMVGLPARGKTHMARRLARYLAFFHGARTKVFNVGEYRRKHVKQAHSDFFDHSNDKNKELRASFAKMALEDMKNFLFEDHAQQQLLPSRTTSFASKGVDSGKVAFYDATNTTKARRQWIYNELQRLPLKLIYIESICTDDSIIDKNIWDAKVILPDYDRYRKKREKAFEDFKQRIANYEKVYERMDEDHMSWVKLINNGQRVVFNRIHGFLPGRIVQFLTNIHAIPHSFYLSRHGQSEYNETLKIGGDSSLTAYGEEYAQKLAHFSEHTICKDANGEETKARLWTSSLQRTLQTAKYIAHPKLRCGDGHEEWLQMDHRIYRNLDELYAGICDGMTYEEIERIYPDDFRRRSEDKFGYRYPRGESYLDILSRLDPLVMEMESYREPLLIIGHQAVLRLLYGYFTGKRREDCPRLSIPLNTVIKLTPRTYDCEEERISLMDTLMQKDGQTEPPSH